PAGRSDVRESRPERPRVAPRAQASRALGVRESRFGCCAPRAAQAEPARRHRDPDSRAPRARLADTDTPTRAHPERDSPTPRARLAGVDQRRAATVAA